MLLLLALACTDEKANAEYPTCVDTPSDIAADAASPAGFSANDILSFSTGAHVESLLWKDGTSTSLTLDLSADGSSVQWIDSVADYPDSGTVIDIGILCTPRLKIPASLAFSTADGAFADIFSGSLIAAESGVATFTVDLTSASLAGTFDPADWPTADYDTLTMNLDATFATGAISTGIISGNAMKDNGCTGDTCSASNEHLDVASWGGGGE